MSPIGCNFSDWKDVLLVVHSANKFINQFKGSYGSDPTNKD